MPVKVGDLVQITQGLPGTPIGWVGTVKRLINAQDTITLVVVDDWVVCPQDLEEPTATFPTERARKLWNAIMTLKRR